MCSNLNQLLLEAKRNNHTNLYLNYRNLDEIPTALLEITSVTRLYLKRNLLTSLPTDLSKLTQLVELYLPSNKLKYLPDEIGKLKTLQCLNVDNNFLTILPKTIGELKNLKKLQMSNNELQEIAPEIGKLKLLEVIEAINNQLKHLPEELSTCTNLTTLSVDRNYIKELPEVLLKLVKLKELSMSRNNLLRLPHDLNVLCCLESLVVDSNSALLVIPSKIFTIQSLHTLGLHGCATRFEEFNETEKVMKSFRKIENLKAIPGNIPRLFELAARAVGSRENEMDFLPSSFKRDISTPKGHCFSCSKPYFSSAFVHLGDINEAYRITNFENNLFSQLRENKCYFAFCFCSVGCFCQVIHTVDW